MGDEAYVNGIYNVGKFISGKLDLHSRDGFQFINCAAGVAQFTAGHFRNDTAAGGHQRREHQSGFISDTPGGMLVHFEAVDG